MLISAKNKKKVGSDKKLKNTEKKGRQNVAHSNTHKRAETPKIQHKKLDEQNNITSPNHNYPAREDKNQSGHDSIVLEEQYRLEEKLEKTKRTIMWSGVTFIMIIILIIWTYTLKASLKPIEPINANNQNINKITDEFSRSMEEMKKSLSQIKSLKEQLSSSTPENAASTATSSATSSLPIYHSANLPTDRSSSTATSSQSNSPGLNELEQLRRRIDELERKK